MNEGIGQAQDKKRKPEGWLVAFAKNPALSRSESENEE